VKSEEKN